MARELVAIGVAAALALGARPAVAQGTAARQGEPVRVAVATVTPAGAADSAARAAADSVAADSLRRAQEVEVLRETFAYSGGSRDPFASLIKLADVGPEIGDLQLVGVYVNHRDTDASVAVVREKSGDMKRYKLRTGDRLGRLRVVAIRPKEVTFAIQDFGYERQETLSLRKQEDVTP